MYWDVEEVKAQAGYRLFVRFAHAHEQRITNIEDRQQ
jgi:hypothetical protein